MKTSEIVAALTHGTIDYPDRMEDIGNLEWVQHPACKGVFLKHLIKGSDSENSLSCHLVKVEPGAVLAAHIHDPQWELHEVIAGSGSCVLGDKEIAYAPGSMAVIPQRVTHSVKAGEHGLMWLAKFFPALL